jgi:hypothetical protein
MHKIRNFQEGHSTVGEWQGSGRIVAGSWQENGIVCVNRPLDRAANGIVILSFRYPYLAVSK